jgi:hypothetical protein
MEKIKNMEKYSIFEFEKVVAILAQLQGAVKTLYRDKKSICSIMIWEITDPQLDNAAILGINFDSFGNLLINADMASSEYIKNSVEVVSAEFYTGDMDMPAIRFAMRQAECICECEIPEAIEKEIIEKGFDTTAEVKNHEWEYVLASFIKKVTTIVNNNINVYGD